MSDPTTTTTTARPRRRRRIVVGILGFVVAFAVGAVAAFLSRTPITGNIDTGQFVTIWSSGGTAPSVVSSQDMTCTVTRVSQFNLKVDVTAGYPGGSCVIEAPVELSGSSEENGKVVGLDMTLPTGWEASLTQGCGITLQPALPQQVRFQVTMTSTAAAGSGGTINGDSGLLVGPLSTNPVLQCTP